jgi:peptidoglycan hydrolase-like protein with peptidoglycan-binding domain
VLTSRRFSKHKQLQDGANNSPALARGANGPGVAELQDALCDLGLKLPMTFAKGRADGIYGTESEQAVKKFQQQHGLKADGIAGKNTLAKLDALIVADAHLDAPSPVAVATGDLLDRGRPLYRRTKANW